MDPLARKALPRLVTATLVHDDESIQRQTFSRRLENPPQLGHHPSSASRARFTCIPANACFQLTASWFSCRQAKSSPRASQAATKIRRGLGRELALLFGRLARSGEPGHLLYTVAATARSRGPWSGLPGHSGSLAVNSRHSPGFDPIRWDCLRPPPQRSKIGALWNRGR